MPAANWYLAEGSTGTNEQGSFETWILVQNPGDEEAKVQCTGTRSPVSTGRRRTTLSASIPDNQQVRFSAEISHSGACQAMPILAAAFKGHTSTFFITFGDTNITFSTSTISMKFPSGSLT